MPILERISERGIKLIALTLVLLLFAAPVAATLWMTTVPGRSYAEPLPPLTADQAQLATRLRAHVTAIASVPHNVAHPAALEASARYVETKLGELGYSITHHTFDAGGQAVRNIEVVIDPAATDAKTLVIGAHYDSYGDVAGANDNGSGAAAVIELARRLADLRGKSVLRLRLVLFVNEEPPWFKTGRMGSLLYARRLARSREPVIGMMALETLGYYSDRRHSQRYPTPLDLLYPDTGNFVAFVGTVSSRGFVRRTVEAFREAAPFPSVGGTAPGFIQGIDWSDHWSFGEVGMPALMVTDTAPFRYPDYHGTGDTPDKLDYERLARVVTGLEAMIRGWCQGSLPADLQVARADLDQRPLR